MTPYIHIKLIVFLSFVIRANQVNVIIKSFLFQQIYHKYENSLYL